jgi:hypothetical protein
MLAPMIQRIALALVLLIGASGAVRAQEAPPRLPYLVVDLHGAFVGFPATQGLADSRGVALGQLPGPTIGGDIAVHIYPLRWRAITFGIGGQVMAARSRQVPAAVAGVGTLTPVTETFVTAAPEISFNFGNGNGWSYISGGIGRSVWQVLPDGADPQSPDEERLQTSNYGGGARWFIKKHVAFSFDVRIYGIKAGTQVSPFAVNFANAPRANLLVIGAGVSIK